MNKITLLNATFIAALFACAFALSACSKNDQQQKMLQKTYTHIKMFFKMKTSHSIVGH